MWEFDARRGVCVCLQSTTNYGVHWEADHWEWDGSAWTQRVMSPSPGGRYRFSMAYDASRRRTVLFGGYNSGPLGDCWEYDGLRWARNPAASLPARYRHSLVYDKSRAVIVMFGGTRDDSAVLNDTIEYDGRTWLSRALSVPPPGRSGHQMVYDPDRNVTRLIGGWTGVAAASDLWEYDGLDWVQRNEGGPTRSYGMMVYDEARHEDVCTGGGVRRRPYISTRRMETRFCLGPAANPLRWTHLWHRGCVQAGMWSCLFTRSRTGRECCGINGDPAIPRVLSLAGTCRNYASVVLRRRTPLNTTAS